MKKLSIIFFLFVVCISSYAQSVAVFTSGRDGYASFRIPAVIKLKDEILAFAEGRVNNSGDFGNIDIVMKRSVDGGKTWSALNKIVDNQELQAGNPAPVVDYLDPNYPGGRIFLFYNTGNNGEGEVRKGKGSREVWFITSTDAGKTWSAPQNITASVHHSSEYETNGDWRSYANTPGHAMQMTTGRYKGRIYVAANHSEGGPKRDFTDYKAHGFYTDDHGSTFRLGATLPFEGSNESTAAELSGSRLMLNARNQRGNIKARVIGISDDGGETWSKTYVDYQLPDPVCEGSLLHIGWKKGKSVLAFSNAADTTNRDRLTLRISTDDGNSWSQHYLVAAGEQPDNGFIAYSDLVQISKRSIGILYEAHHYKEILFTKVAIR
ncbi:exo-alpha-sialidase [Chitinophaga silvatica]|uniref:exo-alpha-sialidase n=1 Tax=Chitinophaga silvatica TaxID=2282649 RepID=A0A3E1YHZ0_9BACT|nr:sialidase family protein [Chitinophaga silvatica]RFS26976.1 exo-alpha-sialidase [Chitinophaga silvatica]